jgi:hypothetical protein
MISSSKVTTVPVCDAEILATTQSITELEFKRSGLERQMENLGSPEDYQTKIAETSFLLSSIRMQRSTAPPNSNTDRLDTLIAEKEDELQNLEDREANFGIVAMERRSFDVVLYGRQIDTLTAYKVSLEAKRPTLAA